MSEIVHYGSPGPVPLSAGVGAGDFLFISGQVPTDTDGRIVPGGIMAQTACVLEKIGAILARGGATLADVVKVTVFLTDIKNFAAMNEVYRRYFAENPPARSCFEVKLAIDAAIEVEAIAYAPQRK